ncbi:hypothetical protein CEP52_008181 [Fusarium oligoseptatum]|uniref:Uncharacterized protein n=1 Tax=Fusarium oligoseptatum TaxID=2604345 RepID=A0A428TJ40_9HYPO|nr:hypothetical protein CEP52_008181 [Fusarium oligoseptatum]
MQFRIWARKLTEYFSRSCVIQLATSTLEDEMVLKALDELLNNFVHKGVDTGDWEKQKALQTIQKFATLASNNKAVHAHISALRMALIDIHDALVMMNTTAKAMAKAVSLLGDQARPERVREFVGQATRD